MKSILIGITGLILGAFAWWAFSPLFIDKTVQDELDPVLEARLEAQRRVDEQQNQTNNAEKDIVQDTTQADLFFTGPFPITGTDGHPATGDVEVIVSAEEKLIRFNEYDGTNGPDLYVYLAKDLEAKEYIDLGPAKGNQGTLIYGMPMEVDVSEYKYVLTWCKAFGVLFDYAEIN